MTIALIAWHVFKDGARSRTLVSLVGFAFALFGISLLLAQLSAGQDLKIIKDIGLSVIELAGVLMAVLLGVGLVAKEIERRSIYALLARPIRRTDFIVGKYLGLVATLAANVGVMTVALYAVLFYIRATSPDAVRLSWDAPALDPAIIKASVLIVAELALLTSVSLFFSTFSSSVLWSTLFSLGVYVAGSMSTQLAELAAAVGSRTAGVVSQVVAVILPAFGAFDVKGQVVHGLAVPLPFVLMTVAYGLTYSAAVLLASAVVFSRRNFE
ncbi:MAG: ABC transporter permease [Acidobacteria bacterium]|nr:MAG: ABC transporter permease [Acidobacteriota bacterium]